MVQSGERRRSFERNIGIITTEQQSRLTSSTVAVAGAGGDGGLVAELLCRFGIGSIRLADPEAFEVENLNRQFGSNVVSLGKNKAAVVGETLRKINPECIVEVLTEGILPTNVDAFVGGANVVVDATEITMLSLGLLLAQECRRHSVPLVTGLNVGFGAVVTAFDPLGLTLEAFLGVTEPDEETPLERWLPYLATYIDPSLVGLVASGSVPAPSVSAGVALTAGFVVTEVLKWLAVDGVRIVAPRVLCVDAVDLHFEIVETML